MCLLTLTYKFSSMETRPVKHKKLFPVGRQPVLMMSLGQWVQGETISGPSLLVGLVKEEHRDTECFSQSQMPQQETTRTVKHVNEMESPDQYLCFTLALKTVFYRTVTSDWKRALSSSD